MWLLNLLLDFLREKYLIRVSTLSAWMTEKSVSKKNTVVLLVMMVLKLLRKIISSKRVLC